MSTLDNFFIIFGKIIFLIFSLFFFMQALSFKFNIFKPLIKFQLKQVNKKYIIKNETDYLKTNSIYSFLIFLIVLLDFILINSNINNRYSYISISVIFMYFISKLNDKAVKSYLNKK